MCKVVQFTFDCGHNLRVRKSRCHGKFRKERRDSMKAACCAEPYLNTRFSIDCGQCQQMGWEKSWAVKLERAQTFLVGLTKAGLPGAQQVSEQIKMMEDEHNEDAWNIRQRFPPLHKPSSIERVKIRTNAPRNSHLRKEVRPEDVVEPKVRSYMEGDDDDDDYVRSTDPLHPIITNYSHPLDNADDSWVDAYLSQEETKLPDSPDIGFDPRSNDWNWGAVDASENWVDNTGVSPGFNMVQRSGNFAALGPEVEVLPSSGIIGIDGLKTEDEEEADENKVSEVLTVFWECVHADDSAHQSEASSSHVENQLQVALQDLTIATRKTHTVTGETQNEYSMARPLSTSSNSNIIINSKKEERYHCSLHGAS